MSVRAGSACLSPTCPPANPCQSLHAPAGPFCLPLLAPAFALASSCPSPCRPHLSPAPLPSPLAPSPPRPPCRAVPKPRTGARSALPALCPQGMCRQEDGVVGQGRGRSPG